MDKRTKLTPHHHWVRYEETGLYRMGLSEQAVKLLGNIIYIELPQSGESINTAQPCGVIETQKAVVDLIMPISGQIKKINLNVLTKPELINESPFDQGWLFLFESPHFDEWDKLITAETN